MLVNHHQHSTQENGNSKKKVDKIEIINAISENDIQKLKSFNLSKEKVNSTDSFRGATLLHWAAFHQSIGICQYLISLGADVNAVTKEENQESVLIWGILGANIQIVKNLIDNGAKIDVHDSQGMSPLMVAVQKGFLFISHYLLSIGDSINHKDKSDHTMVHWASYNGHLHVLKYLVEFKGQRVIDIDSKGRTPLHWSAKQGHLDVCKYLILKGAHLNVLDNDDNTPTFLARTNNHNSVAYLLKHFEKSHNIDLTHPLLQIQKTKTYFDYFKDYYQLGGFIFGFLGMTILTYIISAFSILFTIVNFIVYFILAYKLASYLYGKDNYHTLCVGWFFGTIQMTFYVYYYQIYQGPYSFLNPPIYFICFILMVVLVSWFFSTFLDPGFIPLGSFKDSDLLEFIEKGIATQKKFCEKCFIMKPLRSKHDKHSDRCVGRFDHFCIWTNRSVGFRNHRPFMVFIYSIGIAIIYLAYITYDHLTQIDEISWTFLFYKHIMITWVLFIHNGLFFIFVVFQIVVQTKNMLFNDTIIETIFHDRLTYILHNTENKYLNLFDEGYWKNLLQFWIPKYNYQNLYSLTVSELTKQKGSKLNIECPDQISVVEKISLIGKTVSNTNCVMSNDSKNFFSLFEKNKFENPLNEITLRKPLYLKLLQPSWFKTLVAVLLSIGLTTGINYLYKNYLKPIYEYKNQEKEKNEMIEKQKEKIQNLEKETQKLAQLVDDLSKNLEKTKSEMNESFKISQETKPNLTENMTLKAELAEIKGLILGGNNAKTTIIESSSRMNSSRFEEEKYYQRMNSPMYHQRQEQNDGFYGQDKNERNEVQRKSNVQVEHLTSPKNQKVQEPNVSPILKNNNDVVLNRADSFDDLFNAAMDNKSKNPFLSQKEVEELEESLKKPQRYYYDEEEDDVKEIEEKSKTDEKENSPKKTEEITNKKSEEKQKENNSKELENTYSNYLDSQLKNLTSSIKPFSEEEKEENKETEEEEDEKDQELEFDESLKQLQENADPKLKNSKLFDFFSKFSNEEENNSTATFDEIYGSDNKKIIDNTQTVSNEETKQEEEKLKNKQDLYEQFEKYDFEKDQKYQDLLDFTVKKGTFDNMDEETLNKGKLKLKGKYFKKNFDKSGNFSIDEYLETKKDKKEPEESIEEIDAAPYSESYIDIINKIQNGEELQVKQIDDKPKNSKPKLSKSKLKKKIKPWEKVKQKVEKVEETEEEEEKKE
eukprot:gene2799-4207_t